jgi:hypothetical protein
VLKHSRIDSPLILESSSDDDDDPLSGFPFSDTSEKRYFFFSLHCLPQDDTDCSPTNRYLFPAPKPSSRSSKRAVFLAPSPARPSF